MRKSVFIICIVLLTALAAEAQVRFGVRAGGAYSSMIQKVEGSNRTGARFGFSVAGVTQVPLYKRLSLYSEVAFVNQGGNFLSNYYVDGARNLKNRCNYYSMQLPVNLMYALIVNDIQLSIFGGPTLDFSMFGKMKTEKEHVDIHFGQKEADLKVFDLGVNLGLRVDYSNYFFAVNAFCGTLDMRGVKREGESSLYQNNVTLSLGYMFH